MVKYDVTEIRRFFLCSRLSSKPRNDNYSPSKPREFDGAGIVSWRIRWFGSELIRPSSAMALVTALSNIRNALGLLIDHCAIERS
jgi:hypothetical protein